MGRIRSRALAQTEHCRKDLVAVRPAVEGYPGTCYNLGNEPAGPGSPVPLPVLGPASNENECGYEPATGV